MRGEHSGGIAFATAPEGSSPHARGTPPESALLSFVHGIIPACAGNTRRRYAPLQRQRDHPRMRGEHCPTIYAKSSAVGSSPHARGTLVLQTSLV